MDGASHIWCPWPTDVFWLWSRSYLQENKHPFWKFLAWWPLSSKKNVIIIIVFFLLDICHEAENVQKEVIIVIVFFLLDKGHKAENLQKFLLHYHFPMEDSSESYLQGQGCSSHIAKICVGTKHFTGKANITYLVSYRRSIEIWWVCKIYGRRGGAEPSIYFTNPPYFYRPSVTDQISVLFRQGPWIVYAVTKIGQKSTQAAYIYGRDLRAKMWRYDLRGRRHKRCCEKKDHTTLCRC